MQKDKQTTAVSQLIDQLIKQKLILKNHFEEGKWNDDRCDEIDNCIDLAKSVLELERKQIEDASICMMPLEIPLESKKKAAEQYFTSTFTEE